MGDETIYLMINQYPSQKQSKGDFFFHLSIFFSNLCSQLTWFLKIHRGVYLNMCVCVCDCVHVYNCVWMRNTVYAVVFLNMWIYFLAQKYIPDVPLLPYSLHSQLKFFQIFLHVISPQCTHAKQIFAFQQIVGKGKSWVGSVGLCAYTASQCKVMSWKIIEASLCDSKLTCLSNNLKLEDII